jgi:hypothetical protein
VGVPRLVVAPMVDNSELPFLGEKKERCSSFERRNRSGCHCFGGSDSLSSNSYFLLMRAL